MIWEMRLSFRDCEPPLIGRDEQSKALREGYARIKMGRISEFMLVYGPSGVGKTSLVETLRTPVMVGGGGYLLLCQIRKSVSDTGIQ
jgi:predicted ATPase